MTETNILAPTESSAMRRAMVDSQLRTNAVTDLRLLEAMRRIAREDFVPESAKATAYIDRAIPLGGGRAINPPMTTALLIDAVRLAAGSHVLLIGAATGYAVALLEAMGLKVTGVESDTALIAQMPAGVSALQGVLAQGWAAGAPYDAIIIDGAVDHVPAVISDQLALDGRLSTGLVDRGVTRLAVGRRGGQGFGLSEFADAEAAVLPGFATPKPFTF